MSIYTILFSIFKRFYHKSSLLENKEKMVYNLNKIIINIGDVYEKFNTKRNRKRIK